MKKVLRKEVSSASEQSAERDSAQARFLRVEQEELVSKEDRKENMRVLTRLNCHPELADLHSAEANNPVNCLPRGDEIRIASRLSEQERSSLSETLRAWSKSKTDSGSYQRYTQEPNACKIPGQARNDKMGNKRALARHKHLLTYLLTNLLTKRAAFTMAEILLSLTIIGVVAAITLPSLTGNINERTWNTQRKALYARFSQAIALMPSLNGYGTLTEDASGNVTEDTATETFLTDGLSKVLKINNICDNEHLADCGVNNKYTDLKGTTKSMPTTLYSLADYFRSVTWLGTSYSAINTKAAAFETQNGESIVAYYNPSCKTSLLLNENNVNLVQNIMCVNFIYDLNGTKGPNTVGKDIGFITVLNATDSVVVAPLPDFRIANEGNRVTYSEAISICRQNNNETRLPNIDELSALAINKNLSGLDATATVVDYWSSTKSSPTKIWCQDSDVGNRFICEIEEQRVLCVKR